MDVFYDHQIFSWQQYGGISRYYFELITRLCKMPDVDVSLFMGWYVNEYGLEKYEKFCKQFKGERLKTKGLIVPFKFVNAWLLSASIKKTMPDIYHQTYYDNAAVSARSKRVLTVYDMIHERYPSNSPFYDLTLYKKRESLNHADAIICISESTKNDLLHYYPSLRSRVKVIYLGHAIHGQKNDRSSISGEYIFYVGQRGRHKNFARLYNAYAKKSELIANYKLVCFGGGPFTAKEQREIADHGLEGKVIQLDGDDGLLSALYCHASVLVVPSLYEGFGLPPLEAMSYGCPVLASNTSSLPEVAGRAGLYFDPMNEKDLLDKLETVLSDTDLRDKLIRSGYEQANKFSWDVCAKETLAFYREL